MMEPVGKGSGEAAAAEPVAADGARGPLASFFVKLRENFVPGVLREESMTSVQRYQQVEDAIKVIREELKSGPKTLSELQDAVALSVLKKPEVFKESESIAHSAACILVGRNQIFPAIALNDKTRTFNLPDK